MRNFEYIDFPTNYIGESEFVAYLPKVEGEHELFIRLRDILKFPEYFGENWNALYDCLRDFNWIEEKGVILIHTELPILPETSLVTYVEILYEAVQSWNGDEYHYFKVFFPKSAELILKEMLP